MSEDFAYKVNEVDESSCLPLLQKNNKSKYKRCNKYFRNRKHKNDSVKNAKITRWSEYDWWATDKYNYFNHIKVNDDYKLYSVPFQMSGCRKFCKRRTNKIIRKRKNIGNYGNYRKCFDYWWTMF